MKNFYAEEIQNKKRDNLYRQLVDCANVGTNRVKRKTKELISFASNDYFGHSQNSAVKKAAIDSVKKYGVGSGASRYVTGNNHLYHKLEQEIAKFSECEDSIVFSSGYSCAIGVIPALVGEGDLIVADKLIHSSLIDGAKLSGARLIRFSHNNIDHAGEILAQNRTKFRKCLIVTETVFSMDGDIGLVDELSTLSKKFDSLLIADGAHDLFIKKHKSDLKMGTLSKAIGTLGGYVAGDKLIIDYLRNFAKSQIYSTALPASILAASIKSIQIISKKNLGLKAIKNAEYFCDSLNIEKPQSAIVPIILGDAKKTLEVAKMIEEKGFLVGAIRYPTVEKNKARLRITFSSEHKKSEIEKLAKCIKGILAKFD